MQLIDCTTNSDTYAIRNYKNSASRENKLAAIFMQLCIRNLMINQATQYTDNTVYAYIHSCVLLITHM